jgi:Ribosomal protein L4
MAVQKFVKYNLLSADGTILNSESEYKFKLNITEKSSNYLIHKDILRHQIHNKQGTSSTKVKSEVRGGGRKPWRQKELVEHVPALIVHHYGKVVG